MIGRGISRKKEGQVMKSNIRNNLSLNLFTKKSYFRLLDFLKIINLDLPHFFKQDLMRIIFLHIPYQPVTTKIED